MSRLPNALAVLTIMLAALTMSPGARAVPTLFNGHYYEWIDNGAEIAWTDARAAALALTYNGEPGYLVNITAAEENAFVGSLAPDGWIGATDKDVEGEWRWADGPESGMLFWFGDETGSVVAPFNFASWHPAEPNDFMDLFPGGEDYAHLSVGGVGGDGWNDLPNVERTPRSSYFVEYGSDLRLAPAPEPATLVIFAFGLAGLGMMRRPR